MVQGQLDEALKMFGELLAAEPNDVQSQIHVSEIQRRQGHYDRGAGDAGEGQGAGARMTRS